MAPEISKTHEAFRSSEDEDSDSEELERLESDLKELSHKILEFRSTLPDQLKSTLLSVLQSQRPFLPQLNSGTLHPFLYSRVFFSLSPQIEFFLSFFIFFFGVN